MAAARRCVACGAPRSDHTAYGKDALVTVKPAEAVTYGGCDKTGCTGYVAHPGTHRVKAPA